MHTGKDKSKAKILTQFYHMEHNLKGFDLNNSGCHSRSHLCVVYCLPHDAEVVFDDDKATATVA
jgi:hypothetical protein